MTDTQTNLLRTLLCLIALGVVAAGCIFAFHKMKDKQTLAARRADVRALTQLCLESTNIFSTEDLLARAEARNIQLSSPIPRDLSQPCYILVRPYDPNAEVATPDRILIEETNIADDSRIFVSTMDGAVYLRSRSKQQASGQP